MYLYRFDGVDENLQLLPLAARRALDLAGLKLSRAGWGSLAASTRRTLVELGAARSPDLEAIAQLVAAAEPRAESTERRPDPSPKEVPADLVSALGPKRAIPKALWVTLEPVDRYALLKVASRGRPERLQAAYDEIIGHSAASTHLDSGGGVRMVDVSQKSPSRRQARAGAAVSMNSEAFDRLTSSQVPKGNVLATARIAAIMAAKRTAELIPLCHPLALTHIGVEIVPCHDDSSVKIVTTVENVGSTGVEMEALTAASVAALTVYDMLKAFDRAMTIGPVRLLSKSGGRSGDYQRCTD